MPRTWCSRSRRLTPTSASRPTSVSTSATNRPATCMRSISAGVFSSITVPRLTAYRYYYTGTVTRSSVRVSYRLQPEAGAQLLGHEVQVLGVPGDVATDERAVRADGQAAGAGRVEARPHERGPEALAREGVVDLGVGEDDQLGVLHAVPGDPGRAAVDV